MSDRKVCAHSETVQRFRIAATKAHGQALNRFYYVLSQAKAYIR